jgi:hypothetical protein
MIKSIIFTGPSHLVGGWVKKGERAGSRRAGKREQDGVKLGLLDWQMDLGCQSKVKDVIPECAWRALAMKL